MLNETALVLEGVALGEVVQLVVKVLVDLAAGTVLDQQTAEDALAAHPQNLTINPIKSAKTVPSTKSRETWRRAASLLHPHAFHPPRDSGETYEGIRASAVPFRFPKPR